jgi:PilZ domain
MPELVRSITARLREFLRDRRCARRYAVRLPCRIQLAKASSRKNGGRALPAIEGFTSDISSDGMALVLPAIRIGDHYLVGENHPLLVKLELPERTIELHTVAVRYDSFADGEQGGGYLVGTRITKLGQEDRAQYVELLSQFSRKKVS